MHRFDKLPRGSGWPRLVTAALTLLAVVAYSRAEPVAGAGGCGSSGLLRVELHGSISAAIDWQGAGLDCGGMPRPEGQGARLYFKGSTGTDGPDGRLSFIIALPSLERGQAMAEIPATVTLIEEDRGRFYSSAEVDVCWADVDEQVPDPSSGPGRYRISGLVYCVAPLAEQYGTGGVSFTDLRYSGWLEWSVAE